MHANIRAMLFGGLNRFEADYRVLTLPDKWRWVHVRAKALARDSSGRAQRIVGACVDVDTRRRQEDTLRSQVAILETMREGVVVLDQSGQMDFTNPAFDRMFGCVTGALSGSSIYGLLSNSDSPAKDLHRRLDRTRLPEKQPVGDWNDSIDSPASNRPVRLEKWAAFA